MLRRQASLEETARPVGLARDRPAAGAADVAMPGLRNETGEYNCFLNVIIQCLWHCGDFRAAIMALPPDMLTGADVLLSAETPCVTEILTTLTLCAGITAVVSRRMRTLPVCGYCGPVVLQICRHHEYCFAP